MSNTEMDVDEREALWTQFLQRWPLEKLTSMTLREYNQAGDDDHFCRWVEKHTERLGSIWGGSSLKFGIYSRSSTSLKDPTAQRGVMEDANYGWYTKYGSTAEDAFNAVKQLIVRAAHAARDGRLDEVESIDLWPIYRRKIAFLYQNREQPCILPIYMSPMLHQAWGEGAPKDAVALYRGLMSRRSDKPLLSYADEILAQAQKVDALKDGMDETLTHFAAANGLLEALEALDITTAFVALASGLHAKGLDWWITEAGLVHAGRSEDPEIWQTAVALRVKVSNGAVWVQTNDAEFEDSSPQPLDADHVTGWIEQAAANPRIQALTHRDPYWPDDYGRAGERLTVRLTEADVRGGRVKVPRLQRLFPSESVCNLRERPAEAFLLGLPNGEQISEAWVLSDRRRIHPKFRDLMEAEKVRAGDYAVIHKVEPRHYQLSFSKQAPVDTNGSDVDTDSSASRMDHPRPPQPLNQILYGPPGTGKTYSTIDAALAILDPEYLDQHRSDRSALKLRFDALLQEHRVRFATFHQSFSYEDFVEGLRATTEEDTGQIRYEVVDGVFKSLCAAAAAKVTRPTELESGEARPIDVHGRRIWKMSLGNIKGSEAAIYDECIQNGYALLGWGGSVDFSGCTSREDVLRRFRAKGLKSDTPETDYEVNAVNWFVTRMKPGDLLVISDGNFKFRAIGEVAGDYQFQPHAEFVGDFSQKRAVNWLRTYEPSLPHDELMNNQFIQKTLYELRPKSIDLEKLQRLLGGGRTGSSNGGLQPGPLGSSGYVVTRVNSDLVELTKPNGNHLAFAMNMLETLANGVRTKQISIDDIRSRQAVDKLPGTGLEPYLVNGYNTVLAPLVEQLCGRVPAESPLSMEGARDDPRVLIIDEINRGNISRIFGELITLIEPSKRAGADEQLEVVLPYSKAQFSVPKNVYLIGTMNTADRSLTGMDVALRRRFVFREMAPRPDLLEGLTVEGIPIDRLLAILNQRIEALLDRDHCLGHAYFIPLWQTRTLAKLGEIFRNQVLPLLQEYFFDDWQRIQWVLNDHRKPADFQFISGRSMDVGELFGLDVNVTRNPLVWLVNNEAFHLEESYLGVIDHRDAADDE